MRLLIVCFAVGLVSSSLCQAAPDATPGYQLPPSDFLMKFGVRTEEMPKAPQARLAPVPPYPFTMREAKASGWSEYVIRVDAKGSASSVDLVGYSRKEFGNGSDALKQWRFRAGKNEGIYLLRLAHEFLPDSPAVGAE